MLTAASLQSSTIYPVNSRESRPGPRPGYEGVEELFALERMRRKRGWTRAELGRRARVDPSWIAKIETGRALPYPGQARRLARALGVTAEVLFDQKGRPRR